MLANVLGPFDGSPLVLALDQEKGYDSITDLATMTDAGIDKLEYPLQSTVKENNLLRLS